MGMELNTPILTKTSEDGNINTNIKYGMTKLQGWKKSMTVYNLNSNNIGPNKNINILGIFDGHNGPEISKYLANNFTSILSQNSDFNNGNNKQALIKTFENLDSSLLKDEINKELLSYSENNNEKFKNISTLNLSENDINNINNFMNLFDARSLNSIKIAEFIGASGIVLCINDNSTLIACAGSSRCIVFDKNYNICEKKIFLHQKVKNLEEKKRIENACKFSFDKKREILDKIEYTRGFGNFNFKNNKYLLENEQIIISTPEIIEIENKEIGMIIIGNIGFFELGDIHSISEYFKEKIKNKNDQISLIINEYIDKEINNKKNKTLLDNNVSCIAIDYSVNG